MSTEARTLDLEFDRAPAEAVLDRQIWKSYWLRAAIASVLVVIPCVWHRTIQAGDLSSHVYNAWLAQLIEAGKAPGLYLTTQWHNVLGDVALLLAGSYLGFRRRKK